MGVLTYTPPSTTCVQVTIYREKFTHVNMRFRLSDSKLVFTHSCVNFSNRCWTLWIKHVATKHVLLVKPGWLVHGSDFIGTQCSSFICWTQTRQLAWHYTHVFFLIKGKPRPLSWHDSNPYLSIWRTLAMNGTIFVLCPNHKNFTNST